MIKANNFNVPDIYKGFTRPNSRRDITKQSLSNSSELPVSLACVHLSIDGNLGFMVRSAACFGAQELLVIGSLPKPKRLRQFSCGLSEYLNIKTFSNPGEFLSYSRENEYHLVSLELSEDSMDIHSYQFPLDRKVCIITGNESVGVPTSILYHSHCLEIPMPGFGSCLNTSQAANVALYEYVRQFKQRGLNYDQ